MRTPSRKQSKRFKIIGQEVYIDQVVPGRVAPLRRERRFKDHVGDDRYETTQRDSDRVRSRTYDEARAAEQRRR